MRVTLTFTPLPKGEENQGIHSDCHMEFIEKFKNFLLAPKNAEGISRSNTASKATVKNYLADVKHFSDWIETTYKHTFSPSFVTIQMIHAFAEAKKQTLSASSVDRHLSSLRKFFTFLKLDEEISESPFDIQSSTFHSQAPDPWHLHDFKNYLYVYNSSHLTIKNYIIDVKQFLSWAEKVLRVENAWQIGEKDVLKKIDNKIVDEYKQRLLTEKIFSPASINRKLSSLRKYLGWAGENGFLSQISNIKYQISNIKSEREYQRGGATGDPAQVPATSLRVKPSERGEERQDPSLENATNQTQSQTLYSKIPPIRLVQKFAKASAFTFDLLITSPVAYLFRKIEHETWKIKGKKVFFQDTRYKIQDIKNFKNFKLKIKNYSKEFIRPLSISTKDFPWYKKALHHIRYTRPEWYRRYHRLAIAQYFNWAVLIIFSTAVGFGLYNNFFAKAPGSLAVAPTVTTPIRVLSFQGRLTDANNNPITTPSWIRFEIYNTQSSSSSARLWEEVDKVSPDSDGIFSLLLGSDGLSDGGAASLCNSGNPPSSPATGACGIPSTLFANNNALWLGVTVEATGELAPREQLATVAFASNAETLQGLPLIGASTHTNVVLALNSSGNLDVGASTTFESTSGQFAISGNTVAINTNTGTAGDISIYPDGMGYIDLNRPVRTTTNNSNIASIPNSVEIDDMLGVLATSSGQSAFTVVQNGAGPIISASHSATAELTLQNDGTLILPKYNTADGVLVMANDTTGTIAQTAQGATHTFLRGNGAGAPTFNSIDLSTTDIGTSILGVADGGTGTNLSASAAIGDLLYADSTTTFHRLADIASGSCLLSGGVGIAPGWGSCSSAASTNYWQLNSKVLSPADLNNDLAIGSNSTSSAKFQVFAESVGPVVAGTASTSGNLTFFEAHGTNPAINILNGNSLNFNVSPNGDNGTGYITALTLSNNASAISLSTSSNNPLSILAGTGTITLGTNSTGGNIQFFNGNNTITNAGALTIASNLTVNGTTITVGNGSTSTIGTTNAALNLNSGSGVLTLNSGGSGNIDFFGTSNVITSAGNLSINGTFAVNQGGSATTKTNIDSSGNILPGTDGGANLGSSALEWNNLFVKNIDLPLAGGIGGYWQLSTGANYGVLSPINVQNDLAIGGAATSSATFQVYGQQFKTDSAINSGNILSGTATSSGNLVFKASSGSNIGIQYLNGSNFVIWKSPGGDKGLTAVLTLDNAGNVTIANNLSVSGSVATSLVPTANTLNLGSSSTSWGTLYVNNIQSPITGGLSGYWQLSSGATAYGVLAPANIQNDLAVGGNSTSSASFQVFGTAFTTDASINSGTIPSGTATTSGNLTFRGTAGSQTVFQQNILNGANLGFYNSVGGDKGITSTTPLLYLANNGNVGIGTNTPTEKLSLLSASSPIARFKSSGSSASNVIIDNSSNATAQSALTFADNNGSFKWQLGKQTDNTFFMFDSANNRNFLQTDTSGNVFIQPIAGNLEVGSTTSLLSNVGLQVARDSGGNALAFLKQLGANANADLLTASNSAGAIELQLTNAGNLAARKFSDEDNQSYFLDPAVTSITPALQIAGDASGAANLVLTAAGTGILGSTANQPTIQVLNDADLHFDFTSSTGNNSSFNTAMTIKNNGNVGIGTKTPAYPLEITGGSIGLTNGTANIIYYGANGVAAPGSNTAGEKLQLNGTAGATATSDYALGIEAGYMWFNAPAGAGYKWYRNGNVQIVIDPLGKLGIANTSPTEKLDITGNASESGNLSFRGTDTQHNINILDGGHIAFNTSVGGIGTLNTALFIANGNNTTAGNVGIGTTAPTQELDVEGGNILIGAQTNTSDANTRTWTYQSASAGTLNTTPSIASISAMTVYNGSLYAGTYNSGKAEVYRYNGTTASWTALNATAGTLNTTSAIDGITSMAVYNGYLYVGTSKVNGGAGQAEVYRYDGGSTFTAIDGGAGSIGGVAAQASVSAMTVWNGDLYAGTCKSGGAEVFKYQGGTTWIAVSAAGTTFSTAAGGADCVTSLASYKSFLFAGTSKTKAGNVYRYTSGTTWVKLNNATDGTFTVTSSGGTAATSVDAVTSLGVFNGHLIAGIRDATNGGDLLEYEANVNALAPADDWSRLSNAAGTIVSGGTAIKSVSAFTVYNGRLYVGTEAPGGSEVWRYDGGEIGSANWTKVSQNTAGTIQGGGTTGINMISNMIQYNGTLFAGTYKTSSPGNGEIYSYTFVEGQSYALDFHATTTQAEQNSLQNLGSISFEASPSASFGNSNATGAFLFSNGIITNFGAYDVAEDYPTRDDSLSPGDIVAIDPNEKNMVKKYTGDPHEKVIGVYSSNPGLHLSQQDAQIDGARAIPVALTGRVPVKVSPSGSIMSGDPITASASGVIKATTAGPILGRALQNYDPTDPNAPSTISLYLSNSWYDPNVYLTDTGDFQIADSSPSADFTIPHYYTLSDALGNPVTQVEALAQLVVGSLRAGSVSAQQVMTNSLAIATDNVSIAGVSLHDYILNVVENSGLTTKNSELISPLAEINTIHTDVISPLAENSNIAISLNDSQFSIHASSSAQSAVVARIDNAGNASFSGQIKSQNLAVNGDATISGTLYADKIKANSIEGLSEVVSTLSAQNITNINNIYFSSPSSTPIADSSITGSNDNSSSNSGLLNSTFNPPSSTFANIASYSAFFAYVPNLNATTGIFQQGLVSLGPTSLSDTSITGSLSVGSQLILADTSINVLGSDFAIQPLRQGGVNFEGGLIAINTNGDLTVNGNATFNKGLATNIISPLPGNDLTIRLGHPELVSGSSNQMLNQVQHDSSLNIQNASGSGIFNIDQLGNVVASGAATIGKLNLSLVQPALALSSTEVVATGSAGTATINPYQHEVTIDNPNVTANSLIYITPVGTTQTPYLERQVSGISFSVGIPSAISQSVNFNWLIVN